VQPITNVQLPYSSAQNIKLACACIQFFNQGTLLNHEFITS